MLMAYAYVLAQSYLHIFGFITRESVYRYTIPLAANPMTVSSTVYNGPVIPSSMKLNFLFNFHAFTDVTLKQCFHQKTEHTCNDFKY